MRLGVLMSLGSPWSRELALRLTELGHEVHVIDFDTSRAVAGYLGVQDSFQQQQLAEFRRMVSKIVLLHSRFKSQLRYVAAAPQLRRLSCKTRWDVLLTLYGGGLALLALLARVGPYAVYVVGSDVLGSSNLKRPIHRYVLSAAHLVFANGTYLAQKTRELAPKAAVLALYLGVDTARFHPGRPSRDPCRIVSTRGFMPVYNNEYLIQALATLKQPFLDFRVTFVSGGPTLEEARKLANRILPVPTRGKVEFLGGVDPERLLSELRRAHLFVSLSRSDGTSTSLLEALACGLFPVVSDIPQNREWIDENTCNGLLVPFDRPEILAEGLRRALLDEPWRARASAINRRLVLQRGDARRNTMILIERLKNLAKNDYN
jgi:glycosyltransferase involved in cell wall biosynthesis